jgi:phosphoglycolate phosphatase-like HAD superfamily hydrolase
MRTAAPACVLFDLDGTLLDTAPDLIGGAEPAAPRAWRI